MLETRVRQWEQEFLRDGREEGLRDGREEGLRSAFETLFRSKFQRQMSTDEAGRLQEANLDQVEKLLERIVVADDPDALFSWLRDAHGGP